ncbi:cysteine-rich interactor of PDZ three [Haematococcus lacustris]|uniref:Cysteine-rich interactor of PDZ three n=1 Tax=Haematococcus lacustris TaxID=44745 RepID=A0A6A0AFT7_HAELA|nr:cysteine-rich interactor of PDZ three [Haematococcus lacustris]
MEKGKVGNQPCYILPRRTLYRGPWSATSVKRSPSRRSLAQTSGRTAPPTPSARARYSPYGASKCNVCKTALHKPGHTFCHTCAYQKDLEHQALQAEYQMSGARVFTVESSTPLSKAGQEPGNLGKAIAKLCKD